MALNALEKNKIFGTEQNPKNSVPQGGTEIIFERNTSLLEAAKKCLERRRKTDFSKKDNKNIRIIVYGRNCADDKLNTKVKQLIDLGFYNVYVYVGGLFEWMLLQDIYGSNEFPTTKKEVDILKYCPKKRLNVNLMLE